MTSTAPARRRSRPGPSAAAVLLALVLALVPALFSVPAAHATPAPTEDRKSTFGVQPAGPKEPDARAHFSYGVTGGAAVRDQIAVWNYGDEPLALAVYASDAVNTADGGFDLLPAGVAPKDAGSWIKLEKDKVTVPPKSNVIVPFTVSVPAGSPPATTPPASSPPSPAAVRTPRATRSGSTSASAAACTSAPPGP